MPRVRAIRMRMRSRAPRRRSRRVRVSPSRHSRISSRRSSNSRLRPRSRGVRTPSLRCRSKISRKCDPKELPPQFKRQVVPYATKEPAGTLIIDTNATYLYYVQGDGNAIRYGIGVGREGFTWAGAEKVSRMAEWPDWHPPAEMIERQPYLPRFMAGGDGNPLGARALYLGKTIYRIHGTNQPSTIGKFVSSGCIRMLNDDVEDLYTRVKVGTRVVVLPGGGPASASVPFPSRADFQVLRPRHAALEAKCFARRECSCVTNCDESGKLRMKTGPDAALSWRPCVSLRAKRHLRSV